ncbi:MAG: hypothetical protein AAB418_02420 [candidate division NC10 bacterium]
MRLASRQRTFLTVVLLAALLAVTGVPASADIHEELVKLLIKKGVLTEEEYQALRRQVEKSRTAEESRPALGEEKHLPERLRILRPPPVAEKPVPDKEAKPLFRVFGALDNQARWRDHRDIGDKDRGASSNLHVRRVFVGAEVAPVDFVVGTVVLQSEYVGTSRTDQDGSASATPQIDNASISLGREDVPLYGVFGWRVQPFGAFYNHLIADPMTQDAYEVKRAGATLGSKLPFAGLDVSATVYQGETQIGRLFEANLFDASVIIRTTSAGMRTERDGLRSFNVAATTTPLPELTVGLGYLSEPGDSRRNQTGAVWGAWSFGDVLAHAEYVHALARERFWNSSSGTLLQDSVEERILAAGLAYKLLPDLTLAARYERFWDDGLGAKAAIWSAEHRFSVGGAYTLWKREGFTVQAGLEYRGTDIEPRGTRAIDWRNELFGRILISYE